MIGIVIVSHSAKLAEGVRDLVEQMVQGQVPLAAAGGIEDPENPIGTDATKVYEAIEQVYQTDGVLVLMDMGSALLSTEMALEFLSPEQQANVYLCAAPLVEGAMAAAVQATATNDINLIMEEARNALVSKRQQLNEVDSQHAESQSLSHLKPGEASENVTLTINTAHGLHARPAAQFVSTAGKFGATIEVTNLTTDVGPVSAKSINQLTTLGVKNQHQISVTAAGDDATAALEALSQLVDENFGEAEASSDEAPSANEAGSARSKAAPSNMSSPPADESLSAGIPASPGVAVGPAIVYEYQAITPESYTVDDPAAEWQRLQAATKKAYQDVENLFQNAKAQIGDQDAGIFEAHLLYLDDPAILDAARKRIEHDQLNAEAAWQAAIDQMLASYGALDDDYLRARASDVTDISQRVLRHLTNAAPSLPDFKEPSILIAKDLTPSDTAQLDPDKVLGIVTALGSATAHSAILARSLGIPAVVGAGQDITQVKSGTTLGLDGSQGYVWLDPDENTLSELTAQREAWLAEKTAAEADSQAPAITQDGVQVEVVANIGGLHDVKAALNAGAEGVGLFRTEFLYLDRDTAPSESEQAEVYRNIASALGERPFVIRTLDIGGDKPVPYMQVEPEENPFLGWRGIRLLLDQPEMFKEQLRAILQASPGHKLKIMFPMVATLSEVRAAKRLLAEARAELEAANIPVAAEDEIEVGIMVEVPATVAIADLLAAEVDFFSIGTNDLSQYTMAADRTNAKVAALSDAFQPAVLRLIAQTITAAHEADIWVGLCGEFGGNPLATPILLGLGLDEFSMSAPAIPAVKAALRELSQTETQQLAAEVLELDTAEAVKDHVSAWLAERE